MTMRSYAQNHEDVLLARLFPPGLTGFYIDVGANDPIENSVTKHFYDAGWRGINIEPAPGPYGRLAAERQRDVNLNVGLADQAGSLTFYEFPPESSGGSTFSSAQADWHFHSGIPSTPHQVETRTLADICEEFVGGEIDFLSVDVEGLERQVLAGGDWKRWRPRVVLVEATQPATTIPTHDEWEPILLDAGYLFAAFDGLNRYYVREEDRQLLPALATPVNVTDDYVSYKHFKPLADLRAALDTTSRSLVAARVVNDALWADVASMPEDLAHYRAQVERMDRALAHLRESFESMQQALVVEGEEFARLLAEIGPIGLGVARRLSRLSGRFPQASAVAKRAAGRARSLMRSAPRPT
ncbi:MAG: FkbM family methyltransferase [Acidimicrobiales bacterium]